MWLQEAEECCLQALESLVLARKGEEVAVGVEVVEGEGRWEPPPLLLLPSHRPGLEALVGACGLCVCMLGLSWAVEGKVGNE